MLAHLDSVKKFYSPTKGKMDLKRVIADIIQYLDEEPKMTYKIVIGTDSHPQSEKVNFITAVVIQRVGRGGRYFWQKINKEKIKSLRQRIYEEVNLSLIMAQKMIQELKNYASEESLFSRGLEIHVDIGENGETKNMIKEVVGIVRGNGFNVKTKPEAFGASNVADRHS